MARGYLKRWYTTYGVKLSGLFLTTMGTLYGYAGADVMFPSHGDKGAMSETASSSAAAGYQWEIERLQRLEIEAKGMEALLQTGRLQNKFLDAGVYPAKVFGKLTEQFSAQKADAQKEILALAEEIVTDKNLGEKDARAALQSLADRTGMPLQPYLATENDYLLINTDTLGECRAAFEDASAEKIVACTHDKPADTQILTTLGGFGAGLGLFLGLPLLSAFRKPEEAETDEAPAITTLKIVCSKPKNN